MSERVRLSRKLVLEAQDSVPDGAGGFAVAWIPLGTMWAEMTARTGREDFIAGQARPRVRYRILVRGAPVGSASRPRPDQRFREGARVFSILSVAEHDSHGRYLEIQAEEGIAT